jgi:hypothetical protein
MIPLIWATHNREEEEGLLLGARDGEWGASVSGWEGKQEFWRQMVMMATQNECHLHFRAAHVRMVTMVNFMLHVFYHKTKC